MVHCTVCGTEVVREAAMVFRLELLHPRADARGDLKRDVQVFVRAVMGGGVELLTKMEI